jgi:hypothetical protein
MEGYYTELARLHMSQLSKFVVFPKGVYVDEHNSIHLIMPKRKSLFELVHDVDKSTTTFFIPSYTKLVILTQLAKIINTFHSLKHLQKSHGHLTSHNVFVEIPEDLDEVDNLKVQVSEIETTEFKKYANMFYAYRNVSVWSAPEVLKQPKKLLVSQKAMDVYSFGLIMWELYHESVPFENDLQACTEFVVNGDERPKIQS